MKIVSLSVLTTVLTLFLIFTHYTNSQNTLINKELNIEIESLEKKLLETNDDIKVYEEDKNELDLNFNKILPETVIMSVPKYEQTHNASCESASTHAAVKYFGSDVSEDEIIELIGLDNSPRYFDDNNVLHWGNPQEKFVGDIDGEVVYIDGYGVYNQPVYDAIKDLGFRNSISKTEWEIEDLYSYIKQGYPAIVWISNNYETMEVSTMISSDDTENPWMEREHAVVLRGVDSENVYIMDVGNGSYYTVSHYKFARGFANLDNMAVVVIPD